MNPRTLKIGLALSLVLNIFLVMAVGGAILMRHKLMDNGRGERPNSIIRLSKDMPPESRKAMRRVLREAVVATMPDLKTAHVARIAAADSLAAATPDRALIDRNLQKARESEMRARAGMETAAVSYALTVSPEDRALIAESFRRPPPSAMRRRGKGPDDRGPPPPAP
ncbi:MAG: hypothetical protein RIT46_74 [Pseudomonadota bacterium]|jgi:uncharacterized membrane protein